MGTTNPPVTITAATRKGSGHTNQDRYITGPNFAAVLDGASNFTEEQPRHDGGWYAQTLAAELRELLTARPDAPLPGIVQHAIEAVATEHDLRPATSPTSTIALARWGDEHVETYVLGDSTVAIIHPDGSEHAYSDGRLASIGGHLRRAYRERLASGSGFDEQHQQLLASLQAEQAKWRNREKGYWVAGAEPEAARHGLAARNHSSSVSSVLLATDGAAFAVDLYNLFAAWSDLVPEAPEDVLSAVEEREFDDGDGRKWPRSKRADDKTLVFCKRSADSRSAPQDQGLA